jgi:hypothetical protein
LESVARLASRPAYRFFERRDREVTWRRRLRRAELPALLYALVANKASGMLVARAGRVQTRIFFANGVPRYTSSTDREQLLGARLVQANKIEARDLERAVELAASRRQRLGEVLVEFGFSTSAELLRALLDQLGDRFVALGAWTDGELAYFSGEQSGEGGLPAPMGTWELVTRLVRANYSPAEIEELLGPVAGAPLAAGSSKLQAVSRLGLSHAERRALVAAPGAGSLDELVVQLEQRGVARAERTRRAVFIGLSAGVLVSPGWAVELPRG